MLLFPIRGFDRIVLSLKEVVIAYIIMLSLATILENYKQEKQILTL